MKLTLSAVPQREPHAVRAVARRDITPRDRQFHAHRRGDRAFGDFLRAVVEGAVFLFVLAVIVFGLWMVAP